MSALKWTRVKVRGKTHHVSGPYRIEPLERRHWTTEDRFFKNCVTLKEPEDAAQRDNDR